MSLRGRRGGDDVAAREALTALARARSRSRDGAERFTDLYVWVFCGVLLAVWILSFARETFTGRVCSSGEAGCVLQEHPAYAATAALLLGAGGLLLAAGTVGPVSADRALGRWLLTTTAERAVLLRGPLGATLAGSGLAGAVLGLLTALAGQGGGLDPVILGLGALLGLLAGALLGLVLTVRQASVGATVPGRATGRLLALAGLVLLTVVVMVDEWLPALAEPDGDAVLAWGSGAAGLLTVVLATAVAVLRRPGGRLAELSDAQLARGREMVDAVADSTMMLDGSAVVGLHRRRADLKRGRHRSRPLHGRGAYVFLVADLRLLRRRWHGVALTFLALPAVVVAGEGFGQGGAVLLAAVVAAWAGRQAGQGLRTWLGSSGLRRTVTVPAWQVSAALTLLPALASASVAVPAVLLVDGPWWGGIHLAVAGLASTMRSADPVPAELGAVITTPAGALPTGLLRQLLHGPDLALVLAVALVVVGDPRVLLAAVSALAWQVGRDR